MAVVVINVAATFSLEYQRQKLNTSFSNILKYKSAITVKYERDLNESSSRNASWISFIDTLSCPKNISLSGATLSATIDTNLIYEQDLFRCRGTYNSENLDIYFNSGATDIYLAKLWLYEIPLSSSQLSGTFSDFDTTFLDLWTDAYSTTPDGVDDNFDSDNYLVTSTGTLAYPGWYIDNDANARITHYGYVVPNSGLYNIFWSNDKIQKYIEENTHNTWSLSPNIHLLGSSGVKRVFLDSDKEFRLVLYKIDKIRFNDTGETIIQDSIFWTWQLASLWYIQDTPDLSLSATWATGRNDYIFDFNSNDYAIFIENTSTGALLYQLHVEEATPTWQLVYSVPLKDDEPTLISYLASHIFVDTTGRLISDMREFFYLK